MGKRVDRALELLERAVVALERIADSKPRPAVRRKETPGRLTREQVASIAAAKLKRAGVGA